MDYISKLPDCILHEILLSLLSIRDALKTSVLSKKWYNLWQLSLTLRRDLIFDLHSVLGSQEELFQLGYLIYKNDEDVDDSDEVGDNDNDNLYLDWDVSSNEFIKRVDQFINSFQGTKIGSFCVEFRLNHDHSDTIDRWIGFAIAKGVERINLHFHGDYTYDEYDKDEDEDEDENRDENEDRDEDEDENRDEDEDTTSSYSYYNFPFATLFSSNNNADVAALPLKHMSLQKCYIDCPTNFDFIPFANLRTLELATIEVHENFIPNILSNCQLLEELILDSCFLQSSTPPPKIVSSSLRHLELDAWYVLKTSYDHDDNFRIVHGDDTYRRVQRISLDCPKLTFLECGSCFKDSSLSINAPALKSFRCNLSNKDQIACAFACFATLRQLEILDLHSLSMEKDRCFNNEIQITQPLEHLTHLNFSLFGIFHDVEKLDLLFILPILQACPLLQKLSVTVASPKVCIENQKDMKDFEIFSHDELKVIEVGGCVGNWYEIEFAMSILKCAHNLEKIVMSPHWRDLDDWESNPIWFQNGRERVREHLQGLDLGQVKLMLV